MTDQPLFASFWFPPLVQLSTAVRVYVLWFVLDTQSGLARPPILVCVVRRLGAPGSHQNKDGEDDLVVDKHANPQVFNYALHRRFLQGNR